MPANYFDQDLHNFDEQHANLAREIYRHCVNELRAVIHYRPERYKKDGGGQRHTIFKTHETKNFFLVIDLQVRNRLRIIFPDKDDHIHRLNARWSAKRQGERGKREKYIDIPSIDVRDHEKEILEVIDVVHEKALEYYLRTDDSTETLISIFKEAGPGQQPLKAASLSEKELITVYGDGKCCISGQSQNLEISWVDGFPRLVSAEFNPFPSKFVRKAEKRIPMDVMELVWHRDGGRCSVHGCGSDAYIQFDHLIPKYWRGSNTENNIVLKCRSCNLSKSGKLQP